MYASAGYAEEICTKYGLINEGKMLATGSPESLRDSVSSKISVHVNSNIYPDDYTWQQINDKKFIKVNSENEIPIIVKKLLILEEKYITSKEKTIA